MKYAKILALSAVALVLLGIMLISAALWKGERNMEKDRVEQSFPISESFGDIQIDCDACDLRIEPAGGRETGVHYAGDKRYLPKVEVRDGALYVDAREDRDLPWYQRIGFGFHSWNDTHLTVRLPEEALGTLQIKQASGRTDLVEGLSFAAVELRTYSGATELSCTVEGRLLVDSSSGSLSLRDIRCGSAELESASGGLRVSDMTVDDKLKIRHSSGATTLENVRCGSLDIDSASGEVSLTDTLAEGDFTVNNSSGAIYLSDCDGGELSLHTGSGRISGTLRTEKIFYAQSGSGSVHVPESDSGGVCRAKTGSGSIDLNISK